VNKKACPKNKEAISFRFLDVAKCSSTSPATFEADILLSQTPLYLVIL